jgi:hypothetical protein
LDAKGGTISLNGGFDLTGGTTSFGINNLTIFGQMYLSGNPATLAGSISAHLNNGYIPNVGDSFAVLSYGLEAGAFASQSLPANVTWQIMGRQFSVCPRYKYHRLIPGLARHQALGQTPQTGTRPGSLARLTTQSLTARRLRYRRFLGLRLLLAVSSVA